MYDHSNLHAHVETYEVDCDGPISRDYVLTLQDAEREDQYGDIDFHRRVTGTIINTYSLLSEGNLKVTKLNDGSTRLSWSEVTDEGHRNAEATFCTDECNLTAHGYRDHRAESMGY